MQAKENNEFNAMPNSYEELVTKYPLKPIKNELENEHYLKVYEEISDHYIENPQKDFLGEYLETLSILIEQFEKIAYPIPETTGVDALRFLMKQHNLKQKDLLDIFKTSSILSEILNGKRHFTVEHIKKLSERFNITSDVFI